MNQLNRLFIIVLTLILFVSVNVSAKTESSLQEIKIKIRNGEVSSIWLTDEGIGGIEIDKDYGMAKEEFIVAGGYDTLPDDLKRLASRNNVTIKPSKRYSDINAEPSQHFQRIGIILLSLSVFVIFIFLIVMNHKLSRVLRILQKNGGS